MWGIMLSGTDVWHVGDHVLMLMSCITGGCDTLLLVCFIFIYIFGALF